MSIWNGVIERYEIPIASRSIDLSPKLIWIRTIVIHINAIDSGPLIESGACQETCVSGRIGDVRQRPTRTLERRTQQRDPTCRPDRWNESLGVHLDVPVRAIDCRK